MPENPTHLNIVRAASLRGFESLVRDLGGDPAAILNSCGLKLGDLADPDRYLPYDHAALAIEQAARTLKVRDFGLRLSAGQDMNTLGLLALIMQSASSVREGMLLGTKYLYFHNPALGHRNFMDASQELECLEVFQQLQSLPDMPQVTELCVTYLCRLISVLSDDALRPALIHFRHAPIGSHAQYVRHLGQSPRFNSAFDGISIDPLAWRQPLPSHNQILQDFVSRFLVGLSCAEEQSVSNQVRRVLQTLARLGAFDLGTVARALEQHPRTLQRRLQAEGVVFEELREEAKKQWARQLLDQPGLSLAQVAQMLGFADQSVLTRACQRWFGAAPKRLRRGTAARSIPLRHGD